MMFKPNFPCGLFCLMVNSKLSVCWWISGAKRWPWRSRRFFRDQISEKYESPQRRRLVQAENDTPLPGGGGMALPSMACSHTLSRMSLGIWCWGTRAVVSIVWAILLLSIAYILTIPCTPVFGLKTSVRPPKPANHCSLYPLVYVDHNGKYSTGKVC